MKYHLLRAKIDEIAIQDEADDSAMGDHDSLGTPGRSRGIHHVSKIIRRYRWLGPDSVSPGRSPALRRVDKPIRPSERLM